MSSTQPALTFKSATIYAVRVVLHDHNTDQLIQSLTQRMAEAGGFFESEPVVLDANSLEVPPDWKQLLKAFTKHKLPVLGVCATGHVLESALTAGLTAIEMATSKSVQPEIDSTQTPAPNQATATNAALAANTAQTMVVHGPLRSGQRIYARQTDLIVMGVVSQGAEVIADGNIHIYGPLRGKAMAGARGQTDARIFTTSLDAELVAIAGVYRAIEGALPALVHRKPSMISLNKDALNIEPLSQ